MVATPSLTHTPITTLLLLTLVSASTLFSILDLKHYLPISPTPHFSTETLLSAVLLYQFRVLERLWGTRKYASFIIVSWACLTLLTPTLLVVLKVLTLGWYNYLPPGATGLIFASLAAYTEAVPTLYRYKILTTTQEDVQSEGAKGVLFSDKSTTYFLAGQLALTQFPYGLLPALCGWVVGSAWMGEMLPGGMGRWRVPRWVLGESKQKSAGKQFEGLRRRLEEEGSRDGMRAVTSAGGVQPGEEQRGMLGRFAGYFTSS
ncbi:DSC E3 ubiquitin ligase complex subunit 2 [Cyphellophora attinorum]|uniref:DSC E3 ubiquitin ligase complex subunit 2 n=1 Tax=Cyphellophora attinorum TaxID=1664694 RepID=A0A0N1HAB0_9EURO|nr:DSC E3 ubiquitin ligase complex subunit 2 [Phialophora attinorum]KPI40737.1 DSC E3 ubiquitin ligase complex subunit 2 [Phialophora attinorum]